MEAGVREVELYPDSRRPSSPLPVGARRGSKAFGALQEDGPVTPPKQGPSAPCPRGLALSSSRIDIWSSGLR